MTIFLDGSFHLVVYNGHSHRMFVPRQRKIRKRAVQLRKRRHFLRRWHLSSHGLFCSFRTIPVALRHIEPSHSWFVQHHRRVCCSLCFRRSMEVVLVLCVHAVTRTFGFCHFFNDELPMSIGCTISLTCHSEQTCENVASKFAVKFNSIFLSRTPRFPSVSGPRVLLLSGLSVSLVRGTLRWLGVSTSCDLVEMSATCYCCCRRNGCHTSWCRGHSVDGRHALVHHSCLG